MKKILLLFILPLALFGSTVEIIKAAPGELRWNKLPSMKFYRWKEAGEPPMETRASFMYDDNQLYIRVFCTEPNISEARSQPVLKHDSNVWNNDCIEIFVDLCDNSKRIYQFVCDIHNVNAELVWNDPKFASGLSWNGYWRSQVHYFETHYIVDILIPWRSLGVTEAKDRKIAVNLNRSRTIHPWGRYVLAEKTDKLLDSSKYFRFGPINITAPALQAKAAPVSAAIAGRNRLNWQVANVGREPVQGTLLLAAVTAQGDRILASQKIALGSGKRIKNVFSYTMNETGTFPVKLSFIGNNGKISDLWTDSFVFNSPLDIAQKYLTAVRGENAVLFVRSYLPEKQCTVTVEVADADGKNTAVLKQQRQGREFYLTVPSGKLPEGYYTVTVRCGDFKEQLKLTNVPSLF